jgi:preprotein translocase subunit YajC
MDFFISNAWAQGAPAGSQDPFMSFLPLILIFVIFYFLLIRPQTKRAKEHKKMVSELKAGDEVVTSGGVLGRITEVSEQFIKVEVADGVVLKVQRQTIAGVMPKGTLKSV